MSSMAERRRKRRGKKGCITLSAPPKKYNEQEGPRTKQQISGTVLVPIKDDPNRRAYRQRVDVWMKFDLTIRQQQAAKAIRDAYCRVEALSSGGPLKERVQASPKPDATISMQVEVQSRLVHVMRGVPRAQRHIVEHILWHNRPLTALKDTPRSGARFKAALDAVANHMNY